MDDSKKPRLRPKLRKPAEPKLEPDDSKKLRLRPKLRKPTEPKPVPSICIICIDEYKGPIDRDPCGHRFCKRCLEAWYRHDKQHSCPICRDGKSDMPRRQV